MEDQKQCFMAVVLGVIYDPKKKKVLIVKREQDRHLPELSWVFPGGKIVIGETMEETLRREISEGTGYQVEDLGCVFARILPEKKDLILTYYLCEVTGGELKISDKFSDAKWVDPEELENHFETSFDPRLREYILNLK